MRSRQRLVAVGLLGALASACTCDGGPSPLPPGEPGVVLSLTRDVPFDSIELPATSRVHAPVPPERIPLVGFRRGRGDTFVAPNPIRPRNFYYQRPLPGMSVRAADGEELPHRFYVSQAVPGWTYDRDTITLHGLAEAPADGAFVLDYADAVAREAALNLGEGADPARVARTTVHIEDTARTGLLLPAPGRAAWTLDVPPRAELRFAPGIVPPEVADAPPSDGASLEIALEVDGDRRTLWRGALTPGRFEPVRIDLSGWEGRRVRLHATSDPGATERFDYVFLADPVVASRKARPHRVVLVFVDTLRPDHLSAYGYARDTTPGLARVAAGGARFDQARSVAPWTLPSARTMLTGNDPERYFQSRPVQQRLAASGYATAMFAGNIYLTANFGFTQDWDLHHAALLPAADEQLDRALAWLDDQEGRDAFLLLHLMDAHLPYKEPASHRRLYAGDTPDGLPETFHRRHVLEARLRTRQDRDYVRDRYDNNIRWIDDQLGRLWSRLTEQDVVVYVSDHGEEFWEHGGFEHGHSLYDELLRIPLVIRGPGVPRGAVVDAPVSMLDVTPTILEMAGLPIDGIQGTSLVAASRGDRDALSALRERAQAFGRPLYGRERWGVLDGAHKYTSVAAREEIFDLGEDPDERADLSDDHALVARLRESLGRTLGRDVVVAYRLSPRGARRVTHDLQLAVTVPGGVRAAWVGDDPTESSHATVEVDGERVVARWPAPWRGARDVWVVPSVDPAQVTHALRVEASVGRLAEAHTVPSTKPATIGDRAELLLREETGDRAWELGFGITPLPGTLPGVSGADDETKAALCVLGYLCERQDELDEAKAERAEP